MATLRKRGPRWHVQVRRTNHPTQTATFDTRRQAEVWARQKETRLDGLFGGQCPKDPGGLLLSALVRRYLEEEVPKKRSAPVERCILQAFLRTPLAGRRISDITPGCFAAYRDRRLGDVTAATVCRELAIYQHLFGVAMREWGLGLAANPLASLRKPKRCQRAPERVSEHDLEALKHAAGPRTSPHVLPVIGFAVETAMRRGEILALTPSDVDTAAGLAEIRQSKNGFPRTVPLSPRALDIVRSLKPCGEGRLFEISASALGQAWRRLARRAGVGHLRFHDLRHEAITRLFEAGLSLPEVALVSGHRDHRMLMHYTHLKAADVRTRMLNPRPGT